MPPHSSAPDVLDAYRTTGSSPGDAVSVHLLGPGAVGRALLQRLADEAHVHVVPVTDRSATLLDPCGLDVHAVAAWKHERGCLAGHPDALLVDTVQALRIAAADIVVDATSTDLDRPGWADDLTRAVVDAGRALVFASKDAPARAAHRWLDADADRAAVGIDAVLGGAGDALRAEIDRLRAGTVEVALAGSASTTLLIRTMEEGGSFDEGVARARELALLETDPELDFQGRDAAVKLAVVVQALWGRSVDPARVPCEDIRSLDPRDLRARRARGATTRLVARAMPDGTLAVAYEELPAGHPLAVPRTRVAYRYGRRDGSARLHLGGGLGAPATAAVLHADVLRQAARLLGDRGAREIAAGLRERAPDCPAARLDVEASTRVAFLPADLRLQRDPRVGPDFVAFEVSGPADGPVAVVLGGISADRFPAGRDETPGWWPDQVGPARPLDTDRLRVVALDWLGGNGASWGPRTAAAWPPDCPVSPDDQARGVAAVLDALGVEAAALVVGASYGGMVALRLAALHPERVGRLCLFGAAHESHPMATAIRSIQRRVLRLGLRTGRSEEGVGLARALGLTTYRSALEFAGRFGTEPEEGCPVRFPVDGYLDARSEAFGRRFDPRAYLTLSESLDLHAMDPSELTVPATLVAFDTDTLVPPWSVRALALGAGGRTLFRVVRTKFGHDGFLKESAAVADVLREEVAAVAGGQPVPAEVGA
ncbi:MAG: alpha/beta fold hydrolase [Longimicrobiales bacterium]